MTIRSNQAISGKEGSVYVTIGTERYEMGEIIDIEAILTMLTADVNSIGQRMSKKKVIGAEGTGSLTAHYFSNVVRMAQDAYVKTGVYPDITVHIINADIQAQKGRHSVLLKEVIFEETVLARLDGSGDAILEETTSLTYGDYNILETFV